MNDENNSDWFKRRCSLDREETNERNKILDVALFKHNEKWGKIWADFYIQCEKDGGHQFRNLPRNGINGPNWITGEWPQACAKCGMRKIEESGVKFL